MKIKRLIEELVLNIDYFDDHIQEFILSVNKQWKQKSSISILQLEYLHDYYDQLKKMIEEEEMSGFLEY